MTSIITFFKWYMDPTHLWVFEMAWTSTRRYSGHHWEDVLGYLWGAKGPSLPHLWCGVGQVNQMEGKSDTQIDTQRDRQWWYYMISAVLVLKLKSRVQVIALLMTKIYKTASLTYQLSTIRYGKVSQIMKLSKWQTIFN